MRIRDERERLGLSQQKAADAAGIRREMWARYEAGAEPGAKALAGMASAGADVLYILSGKRGQSTIDPDEAIMLDNYRHSPPEVQAALKAASSAGRNTGKKRGVA